MANGEWQIPQRSLYNDLRGIRLRRLFIANTLGRLRFFLFFFWKKNECPPTFTVENFSKSTSDFIYCIQSPYNDFFFFEKISFRKNKCLSPHNFVCWEKNKILKKKMSLTQRFHHERASLPRSCRVRQALVPGIVILFL